MWESLVNPPLSESGDRWFKSTHADQFNGRGLVPSWVL